MHLRREVTQVAQPQKSPFMTCLMLSTMVRHILCAQQGGLEASNAKLMAHPVTGGSQTEEGLVFAEKQLK